MIRAILVLVATTAVGFTSWDRAPAPAPSMALDSAHWAGLINAVTDPTTGMVSREAARGDSLLRHPGAIGWGRPSLSTAVAVRDHDPFSGIEC